MLTNKSIEEILLHAYNCSVPVGLGTLHYTPNAPSADELRAICKSHEFNRGSSRSWDFDYIRGRAIKLSVKDLMPEIRGVVNVRIDGGWYDHSQAQLDKFIQLLN